MATGTSVGTVVGLWRFPVKSMQGEAVDALTFVGPGPGTAGGAVGDRSWGVVEVASGRVLSAKTVPALLEASAALRPGGGVTITLPHGTVLSSDDDTVDEALSAWLGRPVELRSALGDATETAYDMTFDPPDDDAEYYAIDAPPGSFLDLAAVHVVVRQTLEWCAAQRPDLDWDVRRFRPNLVLDVPGLEPFGEDEWVGRRIRTGSAVLEVMQPTVRCAMPLRAQPGLASQPALYGALEELHANHLGLYLSVAEPGAVAVGDDVELR